jgi:hypothetical protein
VTESTVRLNQRRLVDEKMLDWTKLLYGEAMVASLRRKVQLYLSRKMSRFF